MTKIATAGAGQQAAQDLPAAAEINCMILRLLAKIGFKALLPIAAVVGLVSYMSYMNGGDPAQNAKELVAKVQNSGHSGATGASGGTRASAGFAQNAARSLGNTVDATLGQARQTATRVAGVVDRRDQASGTQAGSGLTTVYRWLGSSGGVEFGTHPPGDALEIKAIGLRPGGGGSSAPQAAAAKPQNSRYPAGKSHTELLQHVSAPD